MPQNVLGGIKQYRAKLGLGVPGNTIPSGNAEPQLGTPGNAEPQLGTSGEKSEVIAKTLISSLKLRRGGTAVKAVVPLELNHITQSPGYKGVAPLELNYIG